MLMNIKYILNPLNVRCIELFPDYNGGSCFLCFCRDEMEFFVSDPKKFQFDCGDLCCVSGTSDVPMESFSKTEMSLFLILDQFVLIFWTALIGQSWNGNTTNSALTPLDQYVLGENNIRKAKRSSGCSCEFQFLNWTSSMVSDLAEDFQKGFSSDFSINFQSPP